MIPNMSNAQKLVYVDHQIENLLDMLDGAEDCKWIYQSLIELSILRNFLSNDLPSRRDQIQGWLLQLHTLDPLRKGRWQDLERSLAL